MKQINNSDYNCSVTVVNNKMPSPNPSKFLYASIELSAKEGRLQDSWKLTEFFINKVSYKKFDDDNFGGTQMGLYVNRVTEIPKDIDAPFTVTLKFINEKDEVLQFEFEKQEIQIVH